MGKGSKILGIILLLLGVACIAMYFVIGENFSNHKVTFDSDGGTVVTEQILKNGEKATKPADPTKDNSEFIDWQLDGVAYNFDNVVTKNITLKANWKEIVRYTIKVTMDGNEYTADIKEGDSITLEALNIPNKDGYDIKFYDETGEEYDITKQPTANLTLTAKYVEMKTYTVKFNSNGGSKVDDVKVTEGKTIEEPTSTRDGYVLDGWYIGEEKFDFTTPITKDITLKARWNDGEKVNVIFMADEKVYKTISVRENTKVTKPANPTKKGYKFVEWQLDGEAFNFDTKITSETTLTAVFEESKTVTVTFDSDGGSKVSTQEIETGGKAKEPTAPTKDGYRFLEWQLNAKKYDFDTAVNNDIKLKAVWALVRTIKFVSDGKEVASQVVVDGEKASRPDDPTKEGYKFVEWLDENHQTYDFNKEVTKNITLTARFEKDNTTTQEPATQDEEPSNPDEPK